MAKPLGVVLYNGSSMLDGRRIVVVATGLGRTRSENVKTGKLIQTWILVEGMNPGEAIQIDADRSICGDCPHRRKACYVNVTQAPAAVWRTYRAGKYPVYSPAEHRQYFKGRGMRFGSYGDPAAVPFHVWGQLLPIIPHRTGYTHQWRTCNPDYRFICMASCETEADRALAKQMGYRTFRIRVKTQTPAAGEIVCPASAEAGYRSNCEKCGACNGVRPGNDGRSDVVIAIHGPPNKVTAYTRRFSLSVI
jgi:hypothetical protein